MKKLLAILFCVLWFSTPAPTRAQHMAGPMDGGPGEMGGPGPGGPSFLRQVFPPGMIMRNQEAIGLTDSQRDAITAEMAEAQKGFINLQWEIERESDKLARLLGADRIDEAAALQQAEQVMNAEQRLKKAHLTLLIRIKNQLTPAQQEKLRQLRPAREHSGGK